tara:strand:+ start:42 stop:944 length:903 start_codon:yes stop_codon:yes gene_type:complete
MTNTIKIQQWQGLFGNNLKQLAGAIFYAKCCKEKTIINLPKNQYFKTETSLEIENEYDIDVKFPQLLVWNNCKYLNNVIDYVDVNEYAEFLQKNIISVYRNEIYEILDKSFNFSNFQDLNRLINLNEDLFIHIRSGDIMSSSAHSSYIQSPWAYFKKILEKVKPKKVVLCTGTGYGTENSGSNPCYNKIVEYCDKNNIKVDLTKRTIREDVYIFSHAKNIVIGGVSSFSTCSSFTNRNFSNIYYPGFFSGSIDADYYKVYDRKVRLHFYEFNDYYNLGKWKPNPKTMLEYPEHLIKEIVR